MKPEAADPDRSLAGTTIAVPETRQLDVLAQLLENRGAKVARCPLVAIHDTPREEPVLAWIRRSIDSPFDLLVIYTGEGIDRLVGFAERAGLREPFVEALRRMPKLARGPKPGRALRHLGLRADIDAAAPTTDGVLETLGAMPLEGKRIGVQLYGAEPNERLIAYLRSRGVQPDCVAPYVYASKSDDDRVIDLIYRMNRGEIDAIAFTSKAQVEQLMTVARRHDLQDTALDGLRRTRVAAVGPVVAQELRNVGVEVAAMPEEAFFMKPLVSELSTLLQPENRSPPHAV